MKRSRKYAGRASRDAGVAKDAPAVAGAEGGTTGRVARVLGIDASLRSTGVGVVEARGNSLVAVEYGVLKAPAGCAVSECLVRLHRGIGDILARCRPEAAAVEGAFYFKNARTAMILGQARGVAVAACAVEGLPVYEYAPRRVKQAIVGFGGAGKEQVRRMIMSLLALEKEPPEDAGDALALAICHLHNQTRHAALMPTTV